MLSTEWLRDRWQCRLALALVIALLSFGNQRDSVAQGFSSGSAEVAEPSTEEQTIPIPAHWRRLGTSELWLDLNNNSVIVAGHICLTRGGLEMFVCPRGTKEHESVIAAHAKSSEVHAALLAVKAKIGHPVEWEPIYKPASGSIINVQVTWRDPQTQRIVTRWGKEMVREYFTGVGLGHDWVFGGSQLETDPDSDHTYYWGNDGELLCVSNFSTATMDLNVPSNNSDGDLLYEAYTENIPPRETKVYVKLWAGDFSGEAAAAPAAETEPPQPKQALTEE